HGVGGEAEGKSPCRCSIGGWCDEVYCCEGCERQAMAVGHKLVCIGQGQEGSPIYEFHKYATHTSETFLIAAAGVAAAVSLPEGTGPFQSLRGWHDPLPVGISEKQ
ncbi:unnamed protein product, partial [Discosporangium mesarthrocarpum]